MHVSFPAAVPDRPHRAAPTAEEISTCSIENRRHPWRDLVLRVPQIGASSCPPLAGRSDLRCFEYAYLKRPTWVLGSGWVFPVGLRAASKLTVIEMTLSEIEDIAVLAERACAAATRVQTHKIHQTIAATRQTEARKFLANLS
jgi:hypothetical protein